MRKTKSEKGITLVALIITIIVLLILAVVAINAVRNDGIIDYAKRARYEYENAQKDEQALLDYYTSQIQSSTGTGISHSGIIPEGAKYIAIDGKEYSAGEKFPELKIGDKYIYGDYEYRFGERFCECWDGMWTSECGCTFDLPEDGWGVRYVKANETPGAILSNISGKPIKSLYATFFMNGIKTAPIIPSTVTNMNFTFYCSGIKECSAAIPDTVKYMYNTFFACSQLEGMITIHANPEIYTDCFYFVNMNDITLAGSSTMKQVLANTGSRGDEVTIID